MDIIARRMEKQGDYYWVFFEHGEINGKPLMMINEIMLKGCFKREGFDLQPDAPP